MTARFSISLSSRHLLFSRHPSSLPTRHVSLSSSIPRTFTESLVESTKSVSYCFPDPADIPARCTSGAHRQPRPAHVLTFIAPRSNVSSQELSRSMTPKGRHTSILTTLTTVGSIWRMWSRSPVLQLVYLSMFLRSHPRYQKYSPTC